MNIISAVVRQYNFFGLEFEFDNVAFRIGEFSVYWYGIIIAVGFLLALLYGYRNAVRYNIDRDRMIDVVIVGLIGAIVCARAYYLIGDGIPLSRYDTFGEKMSYIFGIHNGGIGILGGVFGAFVFGGLTAKLRKIKVLDMFDLAATGFLIGQAVGRWGNFVNQEVYGLPTGSDWFGIGGSAIGAELVHPLFLYEMLWNLATLLVLHNMSKKRRFSGQIFLSYLIAYTFGRYWLEGMRNTDYILMLGKLSQTQLACIVTFIAALIAYIIFYHRSKDAGLDSDYTDMFGEMYDDDDALAAAYGLIGCDEDCTDGEIEAAYSALRGKYEAMLPDETADADGADGVETASSDPSDADRRKLSRAQKKEKAERDSRERDILSSDAPEADGDGMIEISVEELTVRAKAKIHEIDNAYKYILGNRELAAAERAKFSQSTADDNQSTDDDKEANPNDAD